MPFKKQFSVVAFIAITALPLAADSEYGLVIQAVNKLIDKYNQVSLDMAAAIEKNTALQLQYNRMQQQLQDQNATISAQAERIKVLSAQEDDTERIMALEAKYNALSQQLAVIRRGMQAQNDEVAPADMNKTGSVIRAQRVRLKKFIDSDQTPMP